MLMSIGNKILYYAIAIAVALTIIAILIYYLVSNKDSNSQKIELTEQEVLESLSSNGKSTLSQEEINEILKTLSN